MPYFIAAVKKPDLEQGRGGEGGGGKAFGTETTEMPECHQENMMRSAKRLNFKSRKTL